MNSILDISVSAFANYLSTEPREVNLLAWLQSGKYAGEVAEIRVTDNKGERDRIKATLPAITPSGIFTKREAAALVRHSGFIQFDVDNVTDLAGTKAMLCRLTNVAYCGLSVSGRGLWGLIAITDPTHHRDYFEFIEKALASQGITIDKSCKDVSRLRGYSHDPQGYFNHNAVPLKKWYKRTAVTPKDYQRNGDMGTDYDKVWAMVEQIKARRLDFAPDYAQYWLVASALASSFGENGRQIFHAVCQYSPKYRESDADEKYQEALKHGNGRVSLGTFFMLCREHGLESGTQKQAFINPRTPGHIPNKIVWCPTWYVDFAGVLREYTAGKISKDDFLDLQDRNLEQSGLTPEQYVSAVKAIKVPKRPAMEKIVSNTATGRNPENGARFARK